MTVPLLDLGAEYAPLSQAIEAAVREVFEAQAFILGSRVQRFEQRVAELLGVPHAIGVSSGTDALLVSLLAEEIGAGDEVVTTPFSFFATVGSILRVGARPVFVDIDPISLNIDPRGVEGTVSDRTRAILPVHLFGRSADMPQLLAHARARALVVIEDAAQAMGTGFVAEGSGSGSGAGAEQLAGTAGDYGCFSFFPSKNLGAAGDGGLVVCRESERAVRVRRLRAHGASEPHLHQAVGGNFRLDAVQAAVLEVKLPHLRSWVERRRANARRYRRLFEETGLAADEVLPSRSYPIALPSPSADHSYNQFVVRVLERDGLSAHLRGLGIGHAVYYPRPLHLQPALRQLGYEEGAFVHAERAAREVVALPIFPMLSETQAEQVVGAVAGYFRSRVTG